jgi:hypothetical protein
MSYFKTKPRALPKVEPTFHNMSRVLPHYIAENFEYFEILPVPRAPKKNYKSYILNFKKKIACIKAELLL